MKLRKLDLYLFPPLLFSGVDTALQANTDNEMTNVGLRHPRLFRDVSRKMTISGMTTSFKEWSDSPEVGIEGDDSQFGVLWHISAHRKHPSLLGEYGWSATESQGRL
jgi:hypothetical protein